MLSEISDRRLSLDKRMMNSFSMGKNQQDRLLKHLHIYAITSLEQRLADYLQRKTLFLS